jgi:hypothetical protein
MHGQPKSGYFGRMFEWVHCYFGLGKFLFGWVHRGLYWSVQYKMGLIDCPNWTCCGNHLSSMGIVTLQQY